MKFFGKIFFWLVLVVFIFCLQFFLITFFPYPFSQINLIFIFLLWLFLLKLRLEIIWLGGPLFFLHGLFLSTPFLLVSIAAFVSFIIVAWFLLNVFTHRSFYMVFLSGLFGVGLFRFLYFLFLNISNFLDKSQYIFTATFYFDYLWEVFLSAILLTILYTISIVFFPQVNPSYIKQRGAINW